MDMKTTFSRIGLLCGVLLVTLGVGSELRAVQEPQSKKPVVLAVFDNSSRAQYDVRLAPWFAKELASCSNDCQVINYTPYDSEGAFNQKEMNAQLSKALDQSSIILITFNEPLSSQNQVWADKIKQALDKGIVVIGAAGVPKENQPSGPLKKTFLAQASDVLVIGELGERERLLPTSYFGPEMYTAIRSPRDVSEIGIAPAFFATRLAKNFDSRSDWSNYFKEKKLKTKKIWIDLDDIFGRVN